MYRPNPKELIASSNMFRTWDLIKKKIHKSQTLSLDKPLAVKIPKSQNWVCVTNFPKKKKVLFSDQPDGKR